MKYDDIINLSRPVSNKRLPMSIGDRAAQFAPFAALTGHDSSISETARLTEYKIELDDTQKEIINRKLAEIRDKISQRLQVAITHFVADTKKDGGDYKIIRGVIKKFDTIDRLIIFEDKQQVMLDNIIDVEF